MTDTLFQLWQDMKAADAALEEAFERRAAAKDDFAADLAYRHALRRAAQALIRYEDAVRASAA